MELGSPVCCQQDFVASGRLIKSPIHLRNGHYRLAEIKLGGEKLIEEGAASLNSLKAKIDTGRMPAPSFMMIVTGAGIMHSGAKTAYISFRSDV